MPRGIHRGGSQIRPSTLLCGKHLLHSIHSANSVKLRTSSGRIGRNHVLSMGSDDFVCDGIFVFSSSTCLEVADAEGRNGTGEDVSGS